MKMLKKTLWIFCLTFFCSTAMAQTVDELIAKNIEARGGAEKIKAIKSAKFTANMTSGPMDMPITIFWKRPNKVRFEISFQGNLIVQAYDGKTGWRIMPMLGSKDPQKIPKDELEQIRDQADDMIEGPLFEYKKKGHGIELLGKEDMEGSDTYKLKVKLKSGKERICYLDAESFIELKETQKVKRQGVEVVQHSLMGDYQEVGGVMFPHTIDTKNASGQGGQISIKKVELNIDVDDKVFKMPPASTTPKKAK
jgi:outer membrane lipoprotein-sorting protein